MLRRLGLIRVAAIGALVSACGGAATATPSATPSPAATTASVAATPVATVVPPSGGPVPTDLLGSWVGKSDTVPPGVERLTLHATTYTLSSSDGTSAGQVVVNGDEIDFFAADVCGLRLPKGVGRYRWTLTGGILHFDPLEIDPCGRAAVLANANYRR